MARRSPSTSSARSWRNQPETWWKKSGRAWEEQTSWRERPRGWQDTSSATHWGDSSAQEGWRDQQSGSASDLFWQDTRRWQSGRASADANPAVERVRGEEERFQDFEVLRCPWPGPMTVSFPKKGQEGDWWSTKELASSIGLDAKLHYFVSFLFYFFFVFYAFLS